MATVNKDFKIKSGLIVEGTTATVNGFDVLTKKQADQDYVVNLIGGTATSANEVNKVVKRDANGNFAAGEITADLVGDVTGDVTGTVSSLSNHDTADLAENATNKYFTNQRAIDANTGLWDTIGAASAAQAAAEATASADATSKANAAQAAAEATASADATSKANAAQAAAEATAASDATSKANAAEAAANIYTDGKVADLVDSAPELLDTLNELAAAIADNPNYATDVANLVATKADTTYVDSEISDLDTAAQGYANAAQAAAEATASADATSKADAAQSAASADATSKANTAEQNAIAHADALTTDDVEEGSLSLYFTNQRALDAAAQLLTQAETTNITINGTGNGLTIVAENGVADSTTDDLDEGSTNLYFQDSRALGAISGANIQPESIDITWVRREEATWTDVPTASKATCHSAGTNEGSMKYLVRVTASVGGTRHSHVTEVLATVDGSNGVAVVEYGTIYTSTEPLATVTVEWNASTSKYDLNVTTANNSSEVMVAATLMATLD